MPTPVIAITTIASEVALSAVVYAPSIDIQTIVTPATVAITVNVGTLTPSLEAVYRGIDEYVPQKAVVYTHGVRTDYVEDRLTVYVTKRK